MIEHLFGYVNRQKVLGERGVNCELRVEILTPGYALFRTITRR
jgi:hypothetical protein